MNTYTYQDLLNVGDSDKERMNFVQAAISEHKSSDEYKTADTANAYINQQNITLANLKKVFYTATGRQVEDTISPNWKVGSNFFYRFVTQENQYLLGNGITWNDTEKVHSILGEDIDRKVIQAGQNALVCGVSFGFFNLDKVDVFSLLEFVPFFDEENGALRGGVRFWQIDSNKPMRATLYEEDGYTDYIFNRKDSDTQGEILHDKRPYKVQISHTDIAGDEIIDGENYPSFPIIPMYGNSRRQSEFTGLREAIDIYDIIKSQYADNEMDAAQIYWTITNANGMDDRDLAEFLDKLKKNKIAKVDDESQITPHQIDVPYQSTETILERLSRDMYRDAMALDTQSIASGAVTATQIKAAYEPLNSKTDDYEYCVIDFLNGLCKVAGIEGEKPTFTRSVIVNSSEELQNVLQAAQYLSEDYVTTKVLSLLGDGDKADDIIREKQAEDMSRMTIEAIMQQQEQATAAENEVIE